MKSDAMKEVARLGKMLVDLAEGQVSEKSDNSTHVKASEAATFADDANQGESDSKVARSIEKLRHKLSKKAM